jgi:heme/copper-type cytochrome/quinol oxidase subunit 2
MCPAPSFRVRWIAIVLLGVVAGLGDQPDDAVAQEATARREFTITARNYAFSPATVEVQQNDVVKITLHAEDMAHSFTIDEYRIAKRVGRGESVTFEFRADRAGRFRYYCNLKNDERCREMQGELIVRAR